MNFKKTLLSLVKPFFWTRPFADLTLCHFMRRRLKLPSMMLSDLFEDFDVQPVILRQMPRGGWSTPVADIVMLLKLAVCKQPKRLLEIGSYRGYTALYLAQHLAPDAKIVTVDRYPEHGEAYRNTSYANKIERRVGDIASAIFSEDKPASYDFIFIDADHSYAGVRRDTELVLPLVSEKGLVVWHDYANWGFFDEKNGVPEYLGELSQKLPLAHIFGSDLAIYSPAWSAGVAKERFLKATRISTNTVGTDPWKIDLLRG
jgi:hypothetical protein